MNRPSRILSAACLSSALVVLASGPATAQFSDEALACRSTIVQGGKKLAKNVLKTLASCHRKRNASADMSGIDCNDIASADNSGIVSATIDKLTAKIAGACTGVDPASILYDACPAPCAETVPALADASDLAQCMACVTTSSLESLAEVVFAQPDPVLASATAGCHRSITSAVVKLATTILKDVTKCQSRAEKDGGTSIVGCTQTTYDALVADALTRASETVAANQCSTITLPDSQLDATGFPSSAAELAGDVVDATDAFSKDLVTKLLALPVSEVTTTTSTTSTTLPPSDPQCPGSASLRIHSRDSHQDCTDNTDCSAPRTCDTAIGLCTTATDTDYGWSGLAHDNDSNDGDTVRLSLSCEGPADPGCGMCEIAGVDPASGNCRCASDPRILCNDPFAASSSDCGGAACNCYLSTPTPSSGAGTPFCIVPRLLHDVTGTVDVDTGAADLDASLRLTVYLGSFVSSPCPTCGGTCTDNPSQTCDRDSDCAAGTCTLDPTAGDGVRGGVCTEGASAGLPCDVGATNPSYPAYPADEPGGSGYSLDCMPEAGRNISGPGLNLNLESTTGGVSLGSTLSCGGLSPELDCACLVCSTDRTVACSSDGDCAVQPGKCALATGSTPATCSSNSDCLGADAGRCSTGVHRCSGASSIVCTTNADCDYVNLGSCNASTCESSGSGNDPMPNACESLSCTDLGGGEGACTTGPDMGLCDGVLKADGRGLFACSTNVDCAESTLGVDAGECTLVQRYACFPDPITASGVASPAYPVTAAATCMPPTANAAINAVAGLPGPMRQVQQTSLVAYCAGSPGTPYTPGSGGCP